MKASRFLAVTILGIALFGLGCGKKAPGDPDKAVLAAVEAVKANKPGDLWLLLPPSYQKDIQDIATAATSKIDKELFELTVKVLDKAIVVLDKQGDKIGIPITPEQKKMIKDAYALLKEVKLLDYATVSKLDVGAFVNGSGAKLMAFGMNAFKAVDAKEYDEFQKGLAGVKVKVVKTEGDKSELEITMGTNAEKVKMTKVEGRWVPADMADAWKGMIPMAKKQVETGMADMAKNKEEMKKALTAALDALTKAEGGDMSGMEQMMGMLSMFM